MKGLFALLSLLLLTLPAHAEQAKKFGDVEVHYNAMPTDELVPEVAKNYKIDRSRNRGMLTISILKRMNLGVSQASRAKVTASIVTLTGQNIDIPMREIIEGTAVYYIGEFRINAPGTLTFAISAKPEASDQTLSFEFKREFFK
jgi:hypothetical protein